MLFLERLITPASMIHQRHTQQHVMLLDGIQARQVGYTYELIEQHVFYAPSIILLFLFLLVGFQHLLALGLCFGGTLYVLLLGLDIDQAAVIESLTRALVGLLTLPEDDLRGVGIALGAH